MNDTIKRLAAKGIVFFLICMVVLSLFSAKLEELRTPVVLCCGTRTAVLGDRHYSCVVPVEALFWQQERCFVYLVNESTSPFYTWEARRVEVTVLAVEDGSAAVEGIYAGGQQVVRFASVLPVESSLPVQLWEDAA